jgi:hypothetical protein
MTLDKSATDSEKSNPRLSWNRYCRNFTEVQIVLNKLVRNIVGWNKLVQNYVGQYKLVRDLLLY